MEGQVSYSEVSSKSMNREVFAIRKQLGSRPPEVAPQGKGCLVPLSTVPKPRKPGVQLV